MKRNQIDDLLYTLYEDEFDTKKYLYHYTSFSTAIKIIIGDSLRFSMINRLNDTLEAKPKAIFSQNNEEYGKQLYEILNGLNSVNLQLLCFSKDGDKHQTSDDAELPDAIKYSDYIGRGFALPRMWAQYAQNNSGLCLVFNKKKIETIIKDCLGTCLIRQGDVDYVSRFGSHIIDDKEIKKLINGSANSSDIIRLVTVTDFIKNNMEFIKYNYFSKFADWSGENEYRFLAWGDKNHYVKGICDALEAVVVGEDMDKPELEVVKFITNNKCPMLKITFTCNGALLKTIQNTMLN